jgi:molybdate transport system substrate-binding protein
VRAARRGGAILTIALAVALAAALASCGSGYAQLTVFAASSLQTPLSSYGESFSGAKVRGSFAGSDQLAAQIRQGARAGVFASADTSCPARLHREGLVEKPRVFAANRLVIAVPAGSRIFSLADLAKPGTRLVIGDPSVPVGSYTRRVLARLPAGERRAILAGVRSQEPEVSSVIAKLLGGAADAGFVYVTDVTAAPPGRLRAIPVPERLQPEVAYAAAVVKGAPQPRLAHRYLEGLLSGRGAAALRRAGFLPPP